MAADAFAKYTRPVVLTNGTACDLPLGGIFHNTDGTAEVMVTIDGVPVFVDTDTVLEDTPEALPVFGRTEHGFVVQW